jgi:hypothetical protein
VTIATLPASGRIRSVRSMIGMSILHLLIQAGA